MARGNAARAARGFGVGGAACINFKHGHAPRGAHSKEYDAWASMIRRCEMSSQDSFPGYGGRGITIHPAWRADFEAFLRDMGRAPSRKHTIERDDVDGNYEPGNCRWATIREQSLNKRNSRRVTLNGLTLTLAEWSARTGIKYGTLWRRIDVLKWPAERALSTA